MQNQILRRQIVSLLNMKKEVVMREWLHEEMKRVESTYLKTPQVMTGSYNREKNLKKEYDGRQLLELLQNADDETENVNSPEILIKLEDKRLIVANNGNPFQRKGIRSLIYSDNSPKTMSQRKIGYKGLGFRGLLNWSESIWIWSGDFSLEFSRENAISFFRALLKKEPSLGAKVQEQFGQNYDYSKVCPIPTLSAPVWKESWDIDTSLYDTYVVINFSSEEIQKDIQEKINGLTMEVALFLNNLRRIVIESPERSETIERLASNSDDFEEIRILDKDFNAVVSKKWRIFQKSDELPQEFRDETKAEQHEYDFRIAVSENMDANVNRLFCYFKTEVKFPFPAVIHGTFELDDTRNHLVKSEINSFLLKELANLMVDTAKKLAQTEKNVSWGAMRLLAKKGEFDDKVDEMAFYQKLLDAIKSQKLIPVLSNSYMSAEEGPVFYDVSFAVILKSASDIFPDLALYTDDEGVRSLIEDLGIETYEKNQFVEKINRASARFGLRERARLILLIAKVHHSYFKWIEPKKMPNLFIDGQGRVIRSKTQALLPPERAKFSLPGNIRITFISNDLFRTLRTTADVKTGRELAFKINCFNVDEYRFDTVIRRIVATTNRLVRKNEMKAGEYINNMLSFLMQIYLDDSEPNKQIPTNVNVQISSRTGTLRSARELYFGREYFVGKIMEALYAKIDNTVFVSGREELGLADKDEKKVVSFFKWIGVTEYPRVVKKWLREDDYESEYEEFVLKKLPYPYETGQGEVYSKYEDIEADKSYQSVIRVDHIDELNDILQKAAFEDILVWIHSDQRLQRIIREEHEAPDSSFGIWLTSKSNTRDVRPQFIKSFILWKLKTTEWIKTRSGKKVGSEMCCLSRTIIDMSPLIEAPACDMTHSAFKEHDVRQKDVDHVLEKVGIARDFGKLSDKTIYAVLKKLESADPEGKKAKTIYRQIIQSKPTEWAREVRNTESRNEFVEKGKLLAEHDDRSGYLPVREVYYVENITFCKQIMNRFPIAQIDRRSGKEQVADIFGVMPLENICFSLDGVPKIHPLNPIFSGEFDDFRPYVLVFRLQKPTFGVELNRLKRLKIVLCTDIPAKYEFEDMNEALLLHPYENIYIREENTAYLLLKAGRHKDIADLKNDMFFCAAFAEILTGTLKVAENRKDYRDLFPRINRNRDIIIADDLDDPQLEKLEKAKELFKGHSHLELALWKSVLRAKGKADSLEHDDMNANLVKTIADELDLKSDFVKELYEGMFYEEYNNSNNLPIFKKLFKVLGISVQEFNKHSPTQIDFTEHLRTEFENEKFRLKSRFESFVFDYLKDKDPKVKEGFLGINEAFDKSSIETRYNINKKLLLDMKRCFDILFKNGLFRQLNLDYEILLEQRDCNPIGEFSKNKETFKQRINETGGGYFQDIETFLDVVKNRSLLYFGEFDELLERFEKAYSRPPKDNSKTGGDTVMRKKKFLTLNGVDEEFEEDDYEGLSGNIDEDLKNSQYEIQGREPTRPPERETKPGKPGGGGRGAGAAKKYAKEIGFLGEKYVYEVLVKRLTKERVVWASGYARILNVNPEGSDSAGYDLRYSDENGETHYVEVKASKDDELALTISKAEVRFGEQNKSNYEIIIVLNVCDKERRFFNLGKIFEYERDESFSNNGKFKVDTDSFKISFR